MTAIYGLFVFFAQHRTLISVILICGAVAAALPLFRARKPAGAIGVIVAAAVLATANGFVSGDLVNALVYERGPVGPSPGRDAEVCGELVDGVRLARASLGAGSTGLDQSAAYGAAVQAYLAGGCGGEGRDLRALATLGPARS